MEKEVGFVKSIQNYLIYLEGLPSVKINDLIINEQGGLALVTSLNATRVEAVVLDQKFPKSGDVYFYTSKGMQVPQGSKLLGRVIDPLGKPLDGKDFSYEKEGKEKLRLNTIASGIDHRELITEQLITGITLIDLLLPIGKGQRELLFGEPRSGKVAFLLNIIANQKHRNMVCIYTAIGKSEIEIKRLLETLKKTGADEYTIVIAATSSSPTPLIVLAPKTAFALADQFRKNNNDVLLILDDLYTHAKYYRETGLLAGKTPGRESFPGDTFYQHAHLIERAGNFNKASGGGSITLLPVIETGMENLSDLIPTNLMSSTDGHLLFTSDLRAQGQYPAVTINNSVTRVGRQTQPLLFNQLSTKIVSTLAEYDTLKRYRRFGSELTDATIKKLQKGEIILLFLDQPRQSYIDPIIQILMMSLIFTSFYDEREVKQVKEAKSTIINKLAESKEALAYARDLKAYKSIDAFIEILEKNITLFKQTCQF